jgi:hypothetical protein
MVAGEEDPQIAECFVLIRIVRRPYGGIQEMLAVVKRIRTYSHILQLTSGSALVKKFFSINMS